MDLSAKFPVRMMDGLEELSQLLHSLGLYATACDETETVEMLRTLSDQLESHRHGHLARRMKPAEWPGPVRRIGDSADRRASWERTIL
ncbi:hypothetical protein [Sphingosinicella rhizophila]|uniref:Uncharacterized protein n=1 Tax=Sphingosinicella rhizophila TaxID=3050082 RepID=A0ABU3Q4P8_9SPHN|nr:hypothetical protein [Sphingosinicella sp. GR2756]MDT9598395.1 hypothetical protein [Sphingosinicella sp. GR2756]